MRRKQKKASRMAHGQILNAFKMGNQQRCSDEEPFNDYKEPPRPGEGIVYSPEKYRETEGSKDYSGYTASSLKEVDAQTASHMSSNVYWVLKSATSSSMTKRTAASSVSAMGTYSLANNKYTFSGGYVNVSSNTENANYRSAYTVKYTASSYSRPSYTASRYTASSYTASSATEMTTQLYYKSGTKCSLTLWKNYNASSYTKESYTASSYSAPSYTKSTLTVSGTNISGGSAVDTGDGDATITFTPYNTTGGSITYTPETTETVSCYTSLDTTYYAYTPSSATSTTKTFLAKS